MMVSRDCWALKMYGESCPAGVVRKVRQREMVDVDE